jgi:NAD+ synthase
METHEKIINWIQSYTQTNDIKSLVIGVSGGIDSAVTSTLCALTGLPTYTFNLPIHQNSDLEQLSDVHNEWLKKFSNVIPLKLNLSGMFDSFVASIARDIGTDFYNDLAFANTKSRLRMIALYQVAQAKHGIVVGTGNKVEDFGIGFFTKYGDGGVDISPIAGLMKSEVYQIAKTLNVPQQIIDAPPTDGLWDDSRNDEQQIGATYDELEWAMLAKPEDTITERQRQVFEIYHYFHNRNKHKMVPIPVFNP